MATLDPAGQRKGLADSWGTVTYGYDRAGRLTSAGYPDGSTEADTYDPAGNRTGITATTPLSGTAVTTNSYDAADQLSTAATAGGAQPGTTTYGYDGNGNQTGSSGPAGTVANAFNDLNQLTHIAGPGTNLTLLYDGQGDRLRSYERGTPTWTLRNEAQDLAGGLSALVSDGTADYAYLAPGDGSAPLSAYAPGTARATYLGTDLLGSVRLATDPSGATIGAGAYDAWGVARPYTGGSGATQLAGLQGVAPFGYAGQQRDAGPGTYAMRARRYDPSTGRFQSQDPLAYSPQVPVTINPYAYAGDIPVLHSDPSGMIREDYYICSKDTTRNDIDGIFQGHDFAESTWLRHLQSDYAACELQIPFGTRTEGSVRGPDAKYSGPRDGYADLVEDYRGNYSGLYEFEPLDKFIGVTSEGWTWKGNPVTRLGKAQGEAIGYIKAAKMWQSMGTCKRGSMNNYGTSLRLREKSLRTTDDPPGRYQIERWTEPRNFTLGPANPYPILSQPIFRMGPTGKSTWYMVADSAVLPGLIIFRVFKKDLDQDSAAQPEYALSVVPASLGQLVHDWAEELGGTWHPGDRYGWLRPQASCGGAGCEWAWFGDGRALRWVGIVAGSIAIAAVTVVAVGACIGSVVCAATVALGAAVVLASASSPHFADARADHAVLVRRAPPASGQRSR